MLVFHLSSINKCQHSDTYLFPAHWPTLQLIRQWSVLKVQLALGGSAWSLQLKCWLVDKGQWTKWTECSDISKMRRGKMIIRLMISKNTRISFIMHAGFVFAHQSWFYNAPPPPTPVSVCLLSVTWLVTSAAWPAEVLLTTLPWSSLM